MPGKTQIEWADASWNPTTGCGHVSPGCHNCYAEALSLRFGWSKKPWAPENAEENVILHPDRLGIPSHWRDPAKIFVNSMSDLFHPRVPSEFINRVWMEMYNNPRHTFIVLTKRPKRLRDWTRRAATAKGWPEDEIWPDWMWVGTSIESREHVDRADLLRETPAAVRVISAEPLLGPLVGRWTEETGDYGTSHGWKHVWPDGSTEGEPLDLSGISWVIVGGESGPGHRPLDLQWVRDLRDACASRGRFDAEGRDGIAYFVKQLGGTRPGTALEDLPEDLRIREYPGRSNPVTRVPSGSLF